MKITLAKVVFWRLKNCSSLSLSLFLFLSVMKLNCPKCTKVYFLCLEKSCIRSALFGGKSWRKKFDERKNESFVFFTLTLISWRQLGLCLAFYAPCGHKDASLEVLASLPWPLSPFHDWQRLNVTLFFASHVKYTCDRWWCEVCACSCVFGKIHTHTAGKKGFFFIMSFITWNVKKLTQRSNIVVLTIATAIALWLRSDSSAFVVKTCLFCNVCPFELSWERVTRA